jgi:hypothetical protein
VVVLMAVLLAFRQVTENWKLKVSEVGGIFTHPEMVYAVPATKEETTWATMYWVVVGSVA